MTDFIPVPQLIVSLATPGPLSFCFVGYDDFHVTPAMKKSPRVQNFHTVHFVLHGHGVLHVAGKRYAVSAGQSFYLPPNEPMMYYPDENDPWDYCWFASFSDSMAQACADAGFSLENPVLPANDAAFLRERMRSLFEDLKQKREDYFEILAVFYDLMHALASSGHALGRDIRTVRRLLDAGYSLPQCSVESVCREAGFSHAQMCRQFKAAYGVTPVEYLVEKRIRRACDLLESTDMPVYSIAYSCGYEEPAYFMRLFRKKTGMSAGQWRKKYSAAASGEKPEAVQNTRPAAAPYDDTCCPGM